MSRYTGRRGEPKRALLAAHYLACGWSIRRSLRAAGYSSGVANRGKAAVRHSQLLQRAILGSLAKKVGARSTKLLQTRTMAALLASIADGQDDPALLNLLIPWAAFGSFVTRTEYYGKQRPVVFILSYSGRTEAGNR